MSLADVSEYVRLYGAYKDQLLTVNGSLIGGLELDGIAPGALTEEERFSHTKLMRSIFQHLPENTTVYQYYLHHNGLTVDLKGRGSNRSNLLSSRRAEFLNARNLSQGRLFHFYELPFESSLNSLTSPDFVGHLFNAMFSKKSRKIVKTALFDRTAVAVGRDALEQNSAALETELDRISSRLGLVSPINRVMSAQELWAFSRFLYNLSPEYLTSSLADPVPSTGWDALSCEGDIELVEIRGVTFFKLNGVEPVYARVASVVGYGDQHVQPGIWGLGSRPPVMQKGNYLISTRFKLMSAVSSALFFRGKQNELDRASLSIKDMFTGDENKSVLEEHISTADSLKDLEKELDDAKNLSDVQGLFSSHVIIFDKNPTTAFDACRDFNTSMAQAGLRCVWESAGITDAVDDAFLVTSGKYPRDHFFTASQAGAASLIYKNSSGQPLWDMGHKIEEPQYILETDDGTPFYYNPFVNGRGVVIGVGPIRSGKSFTKNTLASHFLKYGGFLRAIDIDPGTEPLAEFFAEEGGVFNFSGEAKGFNPFSVTWSMGDPASDASFKAHFVQQISLMISSNENSSLRELTAAEQVEVEQSITETLRLPRRLQTFSYFSQHCSKSVQQKLSRFLPGGMYASLFDNAEDSVGGLDKAVGVFNLAGVKDNKDLLALSMNEIFFRVTRLFENPDFRSTPKYLDIDEAHNLLKIKQARDYLVSRVRTWGKWLGAIGLWSQSPQEFASVEDWPAIRSAASTLFFMSDPAMDEDLYQSTFLLTDGECEAIRNLIPKKQALIIQREINVSQVVNIIVEPEQYVINTSDPYESTLRRETIKQHPGDVDAAIAQVVATLRTQGKKF